MTVMATAGSWWDAAACRSADPELFFPVSSSGAALADIARAKAVCSGCGVRRECLDYAVQTHQAHGVWGGASEEERRLMAASQRAEPAPRAS